MKSSQFIRDPAKVYSALVETENNELICTKSVKVYIPARYPQHDLAVFEEEITFVGICCFVVDDKYYAVSMIPAFMRSKPSLVNSVTIDDVEYIEMGYNPGDQVIANLNVVKVDSLMYKIYDELIAKGRVPWYLSYEDLGKVFEHSQYHAGVRVGSNPAIFEMIVAAICRNPDDVKQYYRQTIENREELDTRLPTIIPLRAVSYGATNTVAKLMGSHFNENVTSALVSPGERVERVERLLRL